MCISTVACHLNVKGNFYHQIAASSRCPRTNLERTKPVTSDMYYVRHNQRQMALSEDLGENTIFQWIIISESSVSLVKWSFWGV